MPEMRKMTKIKIPNLINEHSNHCRNQNDNQSWALFEIWIVPWKVFEIRALRRFFFRLFRLASSKRPRGETDVLGQQMKCGGWIETTIDILRHSRSGAHGKCRPRGNRFFPGNRIPASSRDAVGIAAGRGNNGGDGFVMARYLHQKKSPRRYSCFRTRGRIAEGMPPPI
jgi:hypothetical protein